MKILKKPLQILKIKISLSADNILSFIQKTGMNGHCPVLSYQKFISVIIVKNKLK